MTGIDDIADAAASGDDDNGDVGALPFVFAIMGLVFMIQVVGMLVFDANPLLWLWDHVTAALSDLYSSIG